MPLAVKYLMDKGVNMEAKGESEETPLHIACKFGDPTIIRFMIESGVNLECQDNGGCRPIHLIIKYSNDDMIKLIIDKKVPSNSEFTSELFKSFCSIPVESTDINPCKLDGLTGNWQAEGPFSLQFKIK